MKIHIFDHSEGYPLYKICNVIDEDQCFEVDEKTLRRWKKVSEDFVKFQMEVADLVRSAQDRNYDLECWDPMEIDLDDEG